LADREALHLLALSGAKQQNIRGQGFVIENKAVRKPPPSLLRLAAVTIGRTDTALGAFYRRLSARAGKSKAVTATARKIAVLFYNAIRHGMDYVDPGRHITRPVTGSELSKIFIGAPKPSGSFCKPQRHQLPSRLFLRKATAYFARESR